MHEERAGSQQALSDLRRRLENGLAAARLSKTQLAANAKLARTTAYEALRSDGPVPSLETVAALAMALNLPAEELLELRRQAAPPASRAAAEDSAEPGRPLSTWDPHDLEVHPAGVAAVGNVLGRSGRQLLSGYVLREHDRVLADAVQEVTGGLSRMVVLVGSSSTGKTRACWEAVQPLAELGWRLWHPFDPTRAEAALEDLHRVGPRTVVWLNEAQHYLGDAVHGERIAAAVHHLLVTPERAPVLVLGTIWPHHVSSYFALPGFSGHERHSQVRTLLRGRCFTVAEAFDQSALANARLLAAGGDALISDALTRADAHGRVTQDLAGAPELLRRYEGGTPVAQAILEAAMDARRLGVGLHLPEAFLTDAAVDYLADIDYQQLDVDWTQAASRAYRELAEPVPGKQAPLSPVRQRPERQPPGTTHVHASGQTPAVPQLKLADFLEQHGHTTRRHQCPPASFWHAAHTHISRIDDLIELIRVAEAKHRLRWAHHLLQKAADAGDPGALVCLAEQQTEAGDVVAAHALLVRAADAGDMKVLVGLAEQREREGDPEGAEILALRAAAAGHTQALVRLAECREETGDLQTADVLLQLAAEAGNTDALFELAQRQQAAGDEEAAQALELRSAAAGDDRALRWLAQRREQAGDLAAAEALLCWAVSSSHLGALISLAELRERAGDFDAAEFLLGRAIVSGDTSALLRLAVMREAAGDSTGAEALLRGSPDVSVAPILMRLTEIRERAGDPDGAETLAARAADGGDTSALVWLAELRERAGDRQGAEVLTRWSAGRGRSIALARLATWRERAGDPKRAQDLLRQAAETGDVGALRRLAELRERAGDLEGAESLLRRAATAGDNNTITWLATMRERAGDLQAAESLLRQAADDGYSDAITQLARIRERVGDLEGAEMLLRRAAEAGNDECLTLLVEKRWRFGDEEGAEALLRRAADAREDRRTDGRFGLERLLKRAWPYGLDPDGAPSLPWA
ncbi:hypothetical protein QMK19_23100 [Streptomyces sp. H10-C2]|uniref:hypothetical protein n=1 Tax=unclassified Streptomyces TaxID=2593676 RepID=UPI0024B9769C|nr:MULTISPECIES: hypothetical protein [unclassified Streptomyces]MDJ0342794.1 hypothetical protein [Streptomyces sp. PH10-H1]MDJ0372472.1 hypothetical protein [Streptomyces sp. H10-C2]